MPTSILPDFFEANDTLAAHLLALGYTDVTSADHKARGKRQFRHPHNRRKLVYFDYIHLKLQHGNGYNWDGYKLSPAGLAFWHENNVSEKLRPELDRLAALPPQPTPVSAGVLTIDDDPEAYFRRHDIWLPLKNQDFDTALGSLRFVGHAPRRTVVFRRTNNKVQMSRGKVIDFTGPALPLTAFLFWLKADMSQPYEKKRFAELVGLDIR